MIWNGLFSLNSFVPFPQNKNKFFFAFLLISLPSILYSLVRNVYCESVWQRCWNKNGGTIFVLRQYQENVCMLWNVLYCIGVRSHFAFFDVQNLLEWFHVFTVEFVDLYYRNIFMVMRRVVIHSFLLLQMFRWIFFTDFIELRNYTTTIFVLSGVRIQHQCAESGYGCDFDSSGIHVYRYSYGKADYVKQVSF